MELITIKITESCPKGEVYWSVQRDDSVLPHRRPTRFSTLQESASAFLPWDKFKRGAGVRSVVSEEDFISHVFDSLNVFNFYYGIYNKMYEDTKRDFWNVTAETTTPYSIFLRS